MLPFILKNLPYLGINHPKVAYTEAIIIYKTSDISQSILIKFQCFKEGNGKTSYTFLNDGRFRIIFIGSLYNMRKDF